MKSTARLWLKRWVWAALVLAVCFQGVNLAREVAGDLRRLPGVLGQPSGWRGMFYNLNPRSANYLAFLEEQIPTETRVVLPPPGDGPRGLSTTAYMGFFLAPRRVFNCTDLTCLGEVRRAGTCVIFLDQSHLSAIAPAAAEIRWFEADWGVVCPATTGGQEQRAVSAPWLAVAWLAVVLAAGYGLAGSRWMGRAVSRLEQAAWGYGLGLGYFSLGMALAGLAGLRLTPALVGGLAVLLALAAWLARKPSRVAAARAAAQATWMLPVVGLGLLAVLLAVGQGYHSIDGIQLWGAKGYAIAADQGLSGATQGTNTLPYPLHLPLLIAASRLLGGESLPLAKALYPGYFLAAAMLGYFALRRVGLAPAPAGLAVLLLASAPLVFKQATIAYANLPLACALLAAVISLEQTLPAGGRLQPGEALAVQAGAAWLVMAAWTRPEGLWMAWGLAGLWLVMRRAWQREARRLALRLVLPLVAYSLVWAVLQARIYAPAGVDNPALSQALAALGQGQARLAEAAYLVKALLGSPFELAAWGMLGPAVVVGLGILLVRLASRRLDPVEGFRLAAGLLLCGLVGGIYYLAAFDPRHDLSWWLATGLQRMLLPGGLLLWLSTASLLHLLDDRQDRPAALHAVNDR